MGNYPDGTWDGDPRAPWNASDPWEGRECGECRYCVMVKDVFVCLFEACENGDPEIEIVHPRDCACESFKEE